MRRWMMTLVPATMMTVTLISLSGCDSAPADPAAGAGAAGGEVAAPAAPAPAPAPAAKSGRTAQPSAETAGGSLTP
jgi:hypothetical protein